MMVANENVLSLKMFVGEGYNLRSIIIRALDKCVCGGLRWLVVAKSDVSGAIEAQITSVEPRLSHKYCPS